ncbi:uncharacterized protein [Dysidea avara]|uniref:uncharacterized protein isoform X3 n=1 Tax=Dysidea avara TaxID=196820 RepID=UPI00331D6A18
MSYRHDFDSDLSPDKNQHKSHDIDHQTRPQGRGHRHDSDSDLSPERTGHKSHRITEDTKDRQEDRGHRHGSDYDLRGGHRAHKAKGDCGQSGAESTYVYNRLNSLESSLCSNEIRGVVCLSSI